jgi:starch phosphorylase
LQIQDQISLDFLDQEAWAKRCIVNVASGGECANPACSIFSATHTLDTGFFSSDRTIKQYAEEIWGAKPVPVVLEADAEDETLLPGE